MNWRWTLASQLIASCLLLTEAHSSDQDSGASQGTSGAVARHSFEALKRRDIATFVSLFHPDEIKRFKTFATDAFKVDKPDQEIQQIRKLFAPFSTIQGVAAASGSDLLTAFLKNLFTSIPNFDEAIANAELQILGEVVERPDKVHVITRIALRPQPVSCQKHDGRWYQLLNDEVLRVIAAFERKEYFRKKNVAIENIQKRMTMDQIAVIGHVKDGDDVAQVLCRIKMKIDDFSFSIFGCYPVRKGEPAWNHLDDKDKTKLVYALRAKWVH